MIIFILDLNIIMSGLLRLCKQLELDNARYSYAEMLCTDAVIRYDYSFIDACVYYLRQLNTRMLALEKQIKDNDFYELLICAQIVAKIEASDMEAIMKDLTSSEILACATYLEEDFTTYLEQNIVEKQKYHYRIIIE